MTVVKGPIETDPRDPRVRLRTLTTTILSREALGRPWSWTTPRLRAKLPAAISAVTQLYRKPEYLSAEDQVILKQAQSMANGTD